MSRIGTINHINFQDRIGEIVDEHDQDIAFLLIDEYCSLHIGERVCFEIELTNIGLLATNIKKLKDLDENDRGE